MSADACQSSGFASSAACLNGTNPDNLSNQDAWLYSILATLCVSACGIIPIVFVPLDGARSLNTPAGASKLRMFLSFAVGSLLGDVFLHLLPEAWRKSTSEDSHTTNGLLVVFGVLSFSFIEKLCQTGDDSAEEAREQVHGTNGDCSKHDSLKIADLPQPKWITGYLSLLANCVDNFIHGLAIGGSFMTGWKVGLTTTFAIVIHEIPHEIGDFAILVRSGFSRKSAAKAQLLTLTGGLLGASAALYSGSSDDMERKASWILPFAAGGFLNIALVNLLPELLQERSILESLKQMVFLSAGVLIMSAVTFASES